MRGVGGSFANETTLSDGGRDAFNPKADAGPDIDANGVTVWTRSTARSSGAVRAAA